MVKFNLDQNHADFVFKVLGPNGISFHLIDRYSGMRQFQSLVRKDIDDSVNLNNLPAFPKKKLFGGLDTAFLETRMNQLGVFMNAFLGDPSVASSKLVMTYFYEKKADQESHQKIESLHKMIQNAKNQQKQGKQGNSQNNKGEVANASRNEENKIQ